MKSSTKLMQYATGICFSVVFCFFYSGHVFGSDNQQTHVVEITNLQFVPAEISVNVGDTIRWVNKDIIPHTATADDKSWDSLLIDTGKSWVTIVEKNTFTSYFCLYHPGMKATIRINE